MSVAFALIANKTLRSGTKNAAETASSGDDSNLA
jgi:hypothetical protein